MAILEKSMKTALDTALNEILKDWKWKTEDRFYRYPPSFFVMLRQVRFLWIDAPWCYEMFICAMPVSQNVIPLGFVRDHARTQSGNTRWRFPKYARRPRKGITIFAYSFAPFYYDFHAVWMRENVATKANGFLDAPYSSFTYSIRSAGWQASRPQILSMFWSEMYLLSRKDWMTPSANNFSLRSLVVLYPASFNASSISILYRIILFPPCWWLLFSIVLILSQYYTEINVKLQQFITRIFVYFANRHYTENSVLYGQLREHTKASQTDGQAERLTRRS